ncbi:GMP synthase [Chryseobacterium sp. Leaf180]|uniref:type 1 glutamine amidotransferase n=1 Tax=Chryseobacterium sp. Leaf180 TaxID=1736289 RepID=UPI0006FBF218|nr:GMP synthase [Chryseobacterium sp. Leaf180]KQR94521.1 GMP synthase [Chryseobacterium sp. Leaf180]
MKSIKIALLDMNDNRVNQGFKNIKEIAETFCSGCDVPVSVESFDVRFKNEMPEVEDYDIFISSGGPGDPHPVGEVWEKRFADFLDKIYSLNENSVAKKHVFLICHSFQMAAIHWKLGDVTLRKSYSFGIMPVHKTEEGENDFIFKNLPEPFFAVDSRAYQFIHPDFDRFEKLNMQVLAIEKLRPYVDLERAVMAVKFSEEIYGTQFHPEANPEGMLENLKDEKNKLAMIESFGMEKYLETVTRIHDDDKIRLTQAHILPKFLQRAKDQILEMQAV